MNKLRGKKCKNLSYRTVTTRLLTVKDYVNNLLFLLYSYSTAAVSYFAEIPQAVSVF